MDKNELYFYVLATNNWKLNLKYIYKGIPKYKYLRINLTKNIQGHILKTTKHCQMN